MQSKRNHAPPTTESYTYDPVGNRLTQLSSAAWTYNTSNELTARPNVTYTYDMDGNTQTMVNSSGTTTYSWDFENRLASVALPGSGGSVYFKYDPFGRRIYKSSSSGTSIYAYDGDNLTEETNATGTAVARYAQGLNIDETLAMLRSAATNYYEADGLGTITSLSNTSGNLSVLYTYDSFGKLTALTGTATNWYRYTGREFDSETGLYYYRARYYDPVSGRFLSEDQLGFVVEGNFYRYVEGNPNVYADPSGNWPTILPSLSNWGRGVLDAGGMTLDFALGTGPQSRAFGPNTIEVNNMKTSPGVDKARDYYRRNGCDANGAPRSVSGGHAFGLKGLVQSGLNPTQQFVGSYDWTVTPNTNGSVTFTLTNQTSMTSLAYHLLPSWDRHALGNKISLPFGNVTQTFTWTEPNPATCGCH